MSNMLPMKKKENKFRKFFQRIFNLPREQKSIYEQPKLKIELDNVEKTFRESCKEPQAQINIEPGSLDYAIDQFLTACEYFAMRTGKLDFYKVLIKLGAMSMQDNKINKGEEESLVERLEDSRKFSIYTQKSGNMEPAFYHIKTHKYKECTTEKVRIYLNAKRSNVALLAGKLLSKFQNDNFYLKFSSDHELASSERSEAIVIYTDPINISNIINKIQELERESPELFEGAENKNPFMKSIGNIAYAPNPENDVYIDRNNKMKKVGKSYNSFLSKALEESFVEAAKEIIAKDKDLTIKSKGVVSNDPAFYLQYLEDIKNSHYRDFLNIIKKELRDAQKRNGVLDIKNIYEDRDEKRYEQ